MCSRQNLALHGHRALGPMTETAQELEMFERRQHRGSSRYFRKTPANAPPERGTPAITHSCKTLAFSTTQISPLPDRLAGGGMETELRHQFHQGRRSVISVMNKPMEETWGVVSFWIRIWALSGLLFWKFIGEIVKHTVLKNMNR
jgi:hypothetical protein